MIRTATEILEQACEWRLLAALLSRPTPERREEARRLAAEIRDLRLVAAAAEWCEHASEGGYLALLGPGGLVPARSVAYQPFADPGAVLSQLAQYQQAFGFHPLAEEPADHIASLAELVSYLWLKEGYARECGDAEAADITSQSRELLFAEHLSPIAAPLAQRLSACGAAEWAIAAELLAERVPAPPAKLAFANEDSTACGSCAILSDNDCKDDLESFG